MWLNRREQLQLSLLFQIISSTFVALLCSAKVNVSFESEEKRDEAMRRNKNYIG